MPITGGRNIVVKNGEQAIFASTGAELGSATPVILSLSIAEASVIGEGVGSLEIPAARFEPNVKFRIRAAGIYNNGSNLPNVTFRVKVNGVAKFSLLMPALDDGDNDQQWSLVADFSYVGGTTFVYYIRVEYNTDADEGGFTWRDSSGTFTADVSAGAEIDFTAQWSATNNALKVQTFDLIEVPIPVDQPLALIGFTTPDVEIPTGLMRLLWSSNANHQISASSTTEQSLLLADGSTVGSLQLPTGFLSAIGSRIRFEVRGAISQSSLPPGMTFRFKLGAHVATYQIPNPEPEVNGPGFVMRIELVTIDATTMTGRFEYEWTEIDGNPGESHSVIIGSGINVTFASILIADLTLQYSDTDFSTDMSINNVALYFQNPPTQ